MRRLAGLVLAAVMLAACSTSPEDPAKGEAEPIGSSVPEGDDMTDALDEHLAWVLAVLNGAEVDEAEFNARFADEFRAQVGYSQFVAVSKSVAERGPFTLGEIEDYDGERGLRTELAATAGATAVLTMHLDADDRIDALLVQPGDPPTLDDPPESVDEAATRLAAIGTLRFVVADESCAALSGEGADDPAPLGSVFKLYVLAAVADAIEAGSFGWDDALTITDDRKSLPSGTLQDRPDGSTVTVREAAQLMISISDNTATDLLLHGVGRGAVEDAQAAYGHTRPDLNTPFLTTRELFLLKAAATDAERQTWIDGDEASRRSLLESLADRSLDEVDLVAFTSDPVHPDQLEWFASPLDICRVLVALDDKARTPGLEPLAEILSENPGVPDDAGRWERILFKGGSEPGLTVVAWLTSTPDGRRFVTMVSVVDPEAPVDSTQIVLLSAAMRDLLVDA